MYARAVDEAAVRLRELRWEELGDFGLAALAFVLAMTAGPGRPTLEIPLLIGTAATAGILIVPSSEPAIRERIKRQAAAARARGLDVAVRTTCTPFGHAPRAIADVARDTAAAVVVIGARGRAPIMGRLLGSVAARLLDLAPCPVLVVPAGRQVGRRVPDAILEDAA